MMSSAIPLAAGGSNGESNLWLACPLCNAHKSSKTTGTDPVTDESHPLTQVWHEHFAWCDDGLRIVGLTPTGRGTVAALHLDSDPTTLEVRSYWIIAGWHPPPAPPAG